MTKFLTGNELNFELEKIFDNAGDRLILISPYIKLHDRYASVLKTKKDNHKLQIIIVFGKNEEDLSRSMKQEDFLFFKEFPNIQIRYERRLHAKYYANENKAILTSMNLYSFSQDNNIEAGIMTEVNLLENLAKKAWDGGESLDIATGKYFQLVVEQSELLFQKCPVYEDGLMGLTRKYVRSKIDVDKLSDFFADKGKQEKPPVRNASDKANVEQHIPTANKSKMGYCIRSGKQIPFNPQKPMSDDAYHSWAKFKNPDYAEKFCHFSGEPSNGETTFSKPILRKNWAEAKRVFGL